MTTLAEQYRPQAWADVVGQDKAVRVLQATCKRGVGGRSYWLSGAPGTGKTTMARLIAGEIADDLAIEEIDAGTLTPAKIEHIWSAWQMGALGRGKYGRALIVNEAHGLSKAAARALCSALDRPIGHVVVVFTTTVDGQESFEDKSIDADALLSRCTVLQLARRDIARAQAEHVRRIAQAENLDGQPIERYVKLAYACKLNIRAQLQAVESGAMLTE